MNFTYYGHSCFSITTESGHHLLFDPFITPNPLASSINIKNIKANYIFLSHGHEDHVANALEIAQNTGALIVSNFEIVSWMQKKGAKQVHPMNTGGSWEFDFGKVICTHAVHSSSMPDGSYGGNPMGFIIKFNKGKCFYYAGDTALTTDMKLIGDNHTLDFALLPIGDNFTMGAKDAAIAAKYINCKSIIGLHYDTFSYIKIDHSKAKSIFDNINIKLSLPEIGKSFEI